MLKKDRILVVGSKPPPINGQSIAFESATRALGTENKIKEIHTLFRSNNIMLSIKTLLLYFYKVIHSRFFYKPKVIYFLCSRSLIGSTRDAFLLLIYYFSDAKIVNHLHGSNFNEFIIKLPIRYRKFLLFLYQRVDKHIVLQDGMQEQFSSIKDSKNKIVIIPNFYEGIADQSDSFISKKDYKPNAVSLLYLSAICTTKGIFDLIQASTLLTANGVPHNLTIAGEGMHDKVQNSKSAMKKFMNEIEGISSIKYIGIIRGEEKYKLLGGSHVFILPTYHESEAIPLSIIEAMRMGCAIITTKHKYLPQLVKDNVNGMLVKPGSPEDICEKITYLYKNRSISDIMSNNISHSKKYYSEIKYQNNICKHVTTKS